MSQDAKVITGIGVITLIIIIIGALFLSNGSNSTSSASNGSLVDTAKADENLLVPTNAYQTGPAHAKITFVEFGDYQCPACGAMYPVVKQLQQKYGKSMNLVFRNFPLTQVHPNAMQGAEAGVAAGNQGKYWQMHDMLYDNQSEWSDLSSSDAKKTFDGYAKKLSLNIAKFDQDLTSKATADRVNADVADGNRLNVNSTPTFYINQHKYLLTSPYDLTNLKKAIASMVK